MGAISYIHLNLEISGMALTHAILTALLEEDLTGYELAKQFDVSLGFFWTASHQQIYQTLKRLYAEELVTAREVSQTGKPDKRVYSLTDSGRRSLDAWVLSETKKRKVTDELFRQFVSREILFQQSGKNCVSKRHTGNLQIKMGVAYRTDSYM